MSSVNPPGRFALLLGMAVLFWACSGTSARPDGGSDAGLMPAEDGGIDAGMDAGPSMTDGGYILGGDAGQPPSEPVITLQMASNPHSVLSAVATVGWTGDITSVHVIYAIGGQPFATTPTWSVSSAQNPTTLPVLWLKASVVYSFVAVGTDSAGGSFYSPPVSFRTAPLPAGFPSFNLAPGSVASPGYTIMASLPGGGATPPDYVTIVDGSGTPVWYLGVWPPLGGDFQQQPNHTYTVAVVDPTAHIPGVDETLSVFRQVDVLGNTLKIWRAQSFQDAVTGNMVQIAATDDHELRIQPNGDALLFGLIEKTTDLRSVGGRLNASLIGSVLERETPEGNVTFAWNSFDYLNPADIDPSTTRVSNQVVDLTHANAIDVSADGNYIISIRNLSQIVKIDSTDGHIIWKLGGKDGEFRFRNDPLHGFSGQHGLRELPNGHLLFFDDGNGHAPPQSRGVEYALDTQAMTATLVWSVADQPRQFTPVLGFTQHLENGDSLVDFGITKHVQEFDPMGNVVWDLTDPSRIIVGIYRAYRIDSLY